MGRVMEEKLHIKEMRAKEIAERAEKYNRAKTWQLWLYPLGGLLNNAFMILMTLVSYYATGIAGLGTVLISFVITGTRIFDAIINPVAGFIIDKTNGKYGKVRPTLTVAYLLMSVSVMLIYYTTHRIPMGFRLIYFILIYGIYIVGYTLSGTATSVGNAIITNDPSQRPVLGLLGMGYTSVFASAFGLFLSAVLVPRYNGFGDKGLFHELTISIVVLGGITLVIALLSIKDKDVSSNFAIDKDKKLKARDVLPILKNNRPLQMFSLAAVSDKLSLQIAGNQIVSVMLFGVVIGNFALSGIMGIVTLVPNLLLLLFGIKYAGKLGTKRAFVRATIASIISYLFLTLLLVFGKPAEIRFDNIGFMTVSFLVLFVIASATKTLTAGLVQPMIPDIVDYEEYVSGRFAPGVVSSVYSFVDKLISSLSQTIVGLMLAMIGFKEVFPDVTTPLTPQLFRVTIFLAFGILLIAWTISLVAMKFYPLDKETMEKIQGELRERKMKAMSKEEKRQAEQ